MIHQSHTPRLFLVSSIISVILAAPAGSQDTEQGRVPEELPVPAGVDLAGSFTFRMAVRMQGAPDDLPTLAANKDWAAGEIRDYTTNNEYGLGRESGTARGFAISVLPDGAWTWNAGNGTARIDHRPEAADQGVADGRWHEVGFSIDQERGVAHLFHDGRRVAIHDLRGVRDLRSDVDAIRLGAAGAKEMEIDAVRLEPGVLSPDRLTGEFVERFGDDRRPAPRPEWNGRPLRVLAWNIWHGGRRKGRDEGVQRVVEVIRQCEADIVLMQETYGSGPRISGRLGFDYFLRSSNLSVMSRFPIVDVHRLGEAFRFGGVTIELRAGVRVQAYSLWISHLPSVREQLAAGATAEELAAADAKTRGKDMRGILDALMPHLARSPDVPVIVGGDFNSGSHLDWTAAAAALPNHMGRVVAWPVSRMMHEAGFVDAFRAAHPDPVEDPGWTWSPEFRESHQDRIDYVYVRGDGWEVEEATVLSDHPRGWPSDHAAVLAVLRLDSSAP
jgi:endonuclease/exonuclease/phosphatase family metal-dependent hydrolase